MNDRKVRIYSSAFVSRQNAIEYSEPQWEREPDETVSDQEYSEWEDRNPSWRLRDELGLYLDSDFIETIDGNNRWRYLETVIGRSACEAIRRKAPAEHNTLILIYEQAVLGVKQPTSDRMSVEYLGECDCV